MKITENKNQIEGVAERIRNTRAEMGFTQTELARACGISRPFIGLIEQGNRKVSNLRLMDDIANALHVHTLWLATGEGEKRNPLHKTTPGEVINDMIATANDNPDNDGPHNILEDVSVETGSVLVVSCGCLEVSVPECLSYPGGPSWVKIGSPKDNPEYLSDFLKTWFDDASPAEAVRKHVELYKAFTDAIHSYGKQSVPKDEDEQKRDVYLGGDN